LSKQMLTAITKKMRIEAAMYVCMYAILLCAGCILFCTRWILSLILCSNSGNLLIRKVFY